MGQMARINEDSVREAGILLVIETEDCIFDYWSQCTTAFEGLIYWSKILLTTT